MTTTSGGEAQVLSRRATVGDLSLFFLDAPGGDPPLVLLHGLSANANCWSAVIAAGLAPDHRVIAPDLRGRGRSAKPDTGYRMPDHAADIIGLLDALGLDDVVLAGHSFGGFLAMYLAAHHPDRVTHLIVVDAAIKLNPRVGEMLKPSLDRLGRVLPSADAYLEEVRSAPYMNGVWDSHTESYFRAELHENPDGSVQSATSSSAIGQAMQGLGAENWDAVARKIRQPALLLNATGPYGPPDFPPLVDEENARATAAAIPNCKYVNVPGNHMTMVFGAGAHVIRGEIERFVANA